MPPEAVKGGATFNADVPQPKGWPTQPSEVVCPDCSVAPCDCDNPTAARIHAFTNAYGLPLPKRTCVRLAQHLAAEAGETA